MPPLTLEKNPRFRALGTLRNYNIGTILALGTINRYLWYYIPVGTIGTRHYNRYLWYYITVGTIGTTIKHNIDPPSGTTCQVGTYIPGRHHMHQSRH